MKKVTKYQYCKECKRDTLQKLTEDALEIEATCTICNKSINIAKTFF